MSRFDAWRKSISVTLTLFQKAIANHLGITASLPYSAGLPKFAFRETADAYTLKKKKEYEFTAKLSYFVTGFSIFNVHTISFT